ncbi:hypothetical protein E2562_039392 [Oryza meyeriana var. granulata]|uniref:Uncharacterized protein n=1 Tax=Oryza meyeriana var. granulata TaxID=110450 RepID=A0A6G1EUK5_9ORYZ|nr:hypothetical protein E2562_039392 [Oryza meyeriana var. granulata]
MASLRVAAAAFPSTLEVGASTASNRLESAGQAVDDLGATAAVLLSHANKALRSVDADGEHGGVDSSSHPSDSASGASWRASRPTKKYTRFEAHVLALHADPATFTEEPEDADGFAKRRQEPDNIMMSERVTIVERILHIGRMASKWIDVVECITYMPAKPASSNGIDETMTMS